MADHDALTEDLARALGIHDAFIDAFGHATSVSLDTKRAIAAAFGCPAGTAAEAAASLARLAALRQHPLPAIVPLVAGRHARVALQGLQAGVALEWQVVLERGGREAGRAAAVPVDGGSALRLPPLPPGYHTLRLGADERRCEALVIAAPLRCYGPAADTARRWGVSAQLTGLRCADDLGIGEYTAAARLAADAGTAGAAFLGLSPVHALFAADRTKISPYSPSSRLLLATIHIDPRQIEGFAAQMLAAHEAGIAALRAAPLADHAAVWAIIRPALEALWTQFRAGGDHEAFAAFRRSGGAALQRHAVFEALSEHFAAAGLAWLGEWPAPFADASSAEVTRFAQANEERVGFHAWLQWHADRQLGAVAAAGRGTGMAVGLYRDLAVGADRGGSEMWANPERFAAALSIGAPPDSIAPQGQDWGLPPFSPLALETQRLAAFRALVVANMRHAGAVRLDHAFQLRRLFLIPVGGPATAGAYVDYPFEALTAVLRLESHRARCLVIAEDLGNAPPGFSDAIMAAGMFSTRLLPFERRPDGAFKAPGDYPREALAAITTHDLPTFRGWWRGLDIDLRQSVGVYTQDMAASEQRLRQDERMALSTALHAEGLIGAPEPPEEPPFEPVVRYLARTRAALAVIQVEDIAGEMMQANLPGVGAEYPSWRRRLSTTLEVIAAPGGELGKLAAAVSEEGRGSGGSSALAAPPPRATYRLQLHAGFTFDDAVKAVPYLAALGISHVYASPIQTARPGSMHGYDIVDHAHINPELGGEDGFVRLSEALKAHDLGLILDIVPNHMGVGGADNAAWLSVLEWGPWSPEAFYFDIDWERLGAHGKLVVPFLGQRYGLALEAGELPLRVDAAEGSFSVWHYEHRFPVCPLQYSIILDRALAALADAAPEVAGEVMAISEHLRTLAGEIDGERRRAIPAECEEVKARLAALMAAAPAFAEAVERAVQLINGSPAHPDSFGTLHRLLEAQNYRVAHWRVAASDINYRRFFDINSLAGLRMEQPELFRRAHALIFRLVAEGRIQGLRVDHIDGLADPAGYCRALQAAVGPGFYVVVEKILERGEDLRPWPIAGTTGYDALNLVDGVFVDAAGAQPILRLYRETSASQARYGAQLREAKTEVLEASFASELEVLVSDLKRLADADRRTRDYTATAIRRALVEIIARFPVYRTFMDEAGPAEEDRRLIEDTVRRAKRGTLLPDTSVHDFIAFALVGEAEAEDPERRSAALIGHFRQRFQQLTGPVMAKSLEDTLFYRYVPLLALNEVGGDPGDIGVDPAAFHAANIARATDWPHAMLASSTHDTKRGEDARARLLALSELPDEWRGAWENFERAAAPLLAEGEDGAVPDADDRWLMAQGLLGALPLDLAMGDGTDGEALTAFAARFAGFVTKALREAKRHTSWVNLDEAYETAAADLMAGVLRPDSKALQALLPLARRLAFAGALNGLSAAVLKCTLPGVPDIYQGSELWDFALVDPDNRRPVDFAGRQSSLSNRRRWKALLKAWPDGAVKQHVLAGLLAARAAAPALFADGDYRPLGASGAQARHLVGFVRRHRGARLAVVVPRRLTPLLESGVWPLGAFWHDARVDLPAGEWRDVLTDARIDVGGSGAPARELFAALPVAVLRNPA